MVEVRTHSVLDALGAHERADDRPYGGGPGMVMRLEPLARILDGILAAAPQGEQRAIAIAVAGGRRFTQSDARRFAALERLVIVCGRSEGIDDRLAGLYRAEELSLGDFVLTGGEPAALAFVDATIRLLPGAIGEASRDGDSFAQGLELDAPAFTRPPVFREAAVPEVLLSGDHAQIAAWRRAEAARRSALRREGERRD